jgi:hypothetical protein
MRFRIPAALALAATVGCIGKADIDPNETKANLNRTPPSQDYNPGESVIPFPNILLLDPKTGLNALPATCGEGATSAALRTQVLNTLDGVGTWLPTTYATFTEQVDFTTANDSTIIMTKVVADPSKAVRVPVQISRFRTLRYPEALPECGTANVVEGLVVVPKIPLDDNSEYVIGILNGVSGISGNEFQPSSAWFFSRQDTAPVEVSDLNGDGVIDTPDEVLVNNTPLDKFDNADANGNGVPDVLETLAGIAQLSQLNHQFLPYTEAALSSISGASVTADDLLIAWAFKTQTVKAPLDPAATRGPAKHIGEDINFGLSVAAQDAAVPPTIEGLLHKPGFCTVAPCADISKLLVGQFTAQNYQNPGPNTGILTDPVPGPWLNPLDPPQATGPVTLNMIATLPAGTMPTGGWPLVVFGHGLQSQKGAALVIAPLLAHFGIATIAIDWPLHGDRAVQIFPIGSGCQSASDPTPAGSPANFNLSPNCFAQILSANLTATRDNFRQGVIDVMHMLASVKATCAHGADTVATACAGFDIDTANMGYMGQSLGSLIGGMDVAMDPDIKAAVLNVPAVSLITVLENTDTLTIKCPLIDALIQNGTLPGTLCNVKSDGTCTNPAGSCAQNKPDKPIIFADPSNAAYSTYQTFATAARWVLDPADSVNFIASMGARIAGGKLALMLQEVKDDQVLPNEATAFLGIFLGKPTPTVAATPAANPPAPTDGVTTPANVLQFLQYVSSDVAKYAHPSLLAPTDAGPGLAGTAQMQVDAVTFLSTHLHSAQ